MSSRAAAFIGRVIVIGTFVLEIGRFTQYAETMGKSRRNVELDLVFSRQQDRFMLTKSRRVWSQIDGNIKYTALGHSDQFSLWFGFLEMQTAQHTFE